MYIVAITRGAPRENLLSNRIMKRKIAEMMVIYKKDARTSAKILDRPMSGFLDSEKVEGIPNEDFPWLSLPVGQFDVSLIIIDDGSSYEIIYLKLFKKMGLNRACFWPYEGFNLYTFNGTTKYPWDMWS